MTKIQKKKSKKNQCVQLKVKNDDENKSDPLNLIPVQCLGRTEQFPCRKSIEKTQET